MLTPGGRFLLLALAVLATDVTAQDPAGAPCQPGYSLENGTCADVDECTLTPKPCLLAAACVNTNGSYACYCMPGTFGDGEARCLPIPARDSSSPALLGFSNREEAVIYSSAFAGVFVVIASIGFFCSLKRPVLPSSKLYSNWRYYHPEYHRNGETVAIRVDQFVNGSRVQSNRLRESFHYFGVARNKLHRKMKHIEVTPCPSPPNDWSSRRSSISHISDSNSIQGDTRSLHGDSDGRSLHADQPSLHGDPRGHHINHRNSCSVHGDPRGLHADQRSLHGNPRGLHADQRSLLGDTRSLHTNRRHSNSVHGNPWGLHADQRSLDGNPRGMHADQRSLHGDPRGYHGQQHSARDRNLRPPDSRRASTNSAQSTMSFDDNSSDPAMDAAGDVGSAHLFSASSSCRDLYSVRRSQHCQDQSPPSEFASLPHAISGQPAPPLPQAGPPSQPPPVYYTQHSSLGYGQHERLDINTSPPQDSSPPPYPPKQSAVYLDCCPPPRSAKPVLQWQPPPAGPPSDAFDPLHNTPLDNSTMHEVGESFNQNVVFNDSDNYQTNYGLNFDYSGADEIGAEWE